MVEARTPYFVKEISSLYSARGSLLVVESMPGIKYGEVVEVETASGETRYGQVIDVSKEATVIQVFGGVKEVDLKRSAIRFKGETFKLPLSLDMLGRTFDGLGRPMDGGPPIVPEDYADINGAPINPTARQPPSEFIETGISAIDGLNSLVRGQKLPIFSGSGLPHNRIAAQIVRQATVKGKEESFAIVFSAIGVTFDDARFFVKNFEETGALERTVVFINTASDPTVERIAAPRVALTTAEFLAWKHDMHVLVILTDMTNYCFHKDTEILLSDGSIVKIGDLVEKALKSSAVPISFSRNNGLAQIVLGKMRKKKIASWNMSNQVVGEIVAVEKVKAPKALIKILTSSGGELLVTEDHKLLVDTEKGPQLIQALEIKPGMELYSIRKLNIEEEKTPYILELLLPFSEEVFVHVKPGILEDKLIRKYGSLRNACKILGIDYSLFRNNKNRRYYRLHEFLTIISDLGLKIEDASKHITYITTGGKEKIKFKDTRVSFPMLKILGWITSDGTIYVDKHKGIYYVSFSSKNKELLKEFINAVKKVFDGVNVEILRNNNGTLIARINSKLLTLLFTSLKGLGENELVQLIKMPEKHISAFISGYIDGDGCINVGKGLIQISIASKVRAKRMQLLLKRLGIQCRLVKRVAGFKKSTIYDIIIADEHDIIKLSRKLTLSHRDKRERLEKLVEKKRVYKRASSFYLAPKIMGKLFKELRIRNKVKASLLGKSNTISQFENGKRRINRFILLKWLRKMSKYVKDDPELYSLIRLVKGNYVLDKVVKVEHVKCNEKYVYDVTVSPTHMLIVDNGIISSNCEALREMSAAREEVPGRRGYPGYMYSVDGSRRVVILDEKGLLKVITLKELFEELSRKSKKLRDSLGFEERIKVKGLYALSVSRNGIASFKPIKYIVRHRYYGKMVKIKTPLGETIVTPNHSIFTLENGRLRAVEAGKLKRGDLIVHVRVLPKFRRHKNVSIDLAKLMGYYVAEGHATKGIYYDKRRGKYYAQHYIRINNTDLNTIEDVAGSFISEFNINPSIIVSDKISGTLRVSTGRKRIYNLLVKKYKIGSKAREKTVPPEILSSNIEIQKAFFEAFYAGNGKSQDPRYKIKQYDIVTVSEKLRDSMIWLVKQIFPNRYPVIYKWPRRNVWKIYLSTKLKAKHVILNDIIAVEVKSLEYVDPSDNWVYDLSVEDNENFVEGCGGIILHNTDLATMYERAGRIWGKKGSVTIMPILTMPDDDITHPIPDLTGYITEGQLVLSRDLHRKGIYPPMDVFLSLSRLMKEGIGPGKTREDHRDVFMQLYAAYAEGQHLRELSIIVGTEALSERDKKYLKFADEFEQRFIKQGEYERRAIEETLDIAWNLLSIVPEEELKLIREKFIRKYHPKYRES